MVIVTIRTIVHTLATWLARSREKDPSPSRNELFRRVRVYKHVIIKEFKATKR